MFRWFRKTPQTPPEPVEPSVVGQPEPVAVPDPVAIVGYRPRPMMINPVGDVAMESDWYRLNAITRHCEQLVEAGGDAGHRLIWKAQHFVEATERFTALKKSLRDMPDNAKKMIGQTKLRELRDRLKKIGWIADHIEGDE